MAQLRYLPRLLGRIEGRIFTIASLVFLIGIILLIYSVFAQLSTLEARAGGSYTEVLVGKPEHINPLWASANEVDQDLVRLTYAGLLRYNTNLELVPDLAEGFEITEDGKIYTFTLRESLKWQDKEPLTSSDVVFTVQAAQNPAWKSPLYTEFLDLTVSAPDPKTVVFTLQEPFAPFLHALTVGILPEHLWRDIAPEGARLAELNLKPIGAGPFRVKKIRKTKQGILQSYTLEVNPHYHNQKPLLKNLILKFTPSPDAAVAMLASGNAGGLSFVPEEMRDELGRRADLEYYDLPLTQLVAIFFNQKQNVILAQKEMRQALAQAMPREKIIDEAFGNRAVPVLGPMLPGFLGYTEDVSLYPFDLNAAMGLLEENGWRLGEEAPVRTFAGKSKSDKRFIKDTELTIRLTTVNVPEYVRTAEMVREAWQNIGVKTEISVIDPGRIMQEVVGPRNYDTLLFGVLMDADPDPYPFWHSSQAGEEGVNLANYANRRVDALIEEARALSDSNERATRYEEFQKTVTEELPAIFLLEPRYIYAIDKSLHGVRFDRLASPADRFANVIEWHVKTKAKLK